MNLTHRESNADDLKQLQKWTEADSTHKDLLPAEFWLPSIDAEGKKELGVKCLAVEGPSGVKFYLRMENVMRVYVQFPPEGEYDPEDMKQALETSFRFVASGAKKIGYKSMVFNSVSKSLIHFFSKFGFTEVKNTYGAAL